MENNCSWCNQPATRLQEVTIKALIYSNDYPVITPQFKPVCNSCEQEIKEYKKSWELVSH